MSVFHSFELVYGERKTDFPEEGAVVGIVYFQVLVVGDPYFCLAVDALYVKVFHMDVFFGALSFLVQRHDVFSLVVEAVDGGAG